MAQQLCAWAATHDPHPPARTCNPRRRHPARHLAALQRRGRCASAAEPRCGCQHDPRGAGGTRGSGLLAAPCSSDPAPACLPPAVPPRPAVYRRTYRRVLAQNAKYYQRFPMDVERIQVGGVGMARWVKRLETGRRGAAEGAEPGALCSHQTLLCRSCLGVRPPLTCHSRAFTPVENRAAPGGAAGRRRADAHGQQAQPAVGGRARVWGVLRVPRACRVSQAGSAAGAPVLALH